MCRVSGPPPPPQPLLPPPPPVVRAPPLAPPPGWAHIALYSASELELSNKITFCRAHLHYDGNTLLTPSYPPACTLLSCSAFIPTIPPSLLSPMDVPQYFEHLPTCSPLASCSAGCNIQLDGRQAADNEGSRRVIDQRVGGCVTVPSARAALSSSRHSEGCSHPDNPPPCDTHISNTHGQRIPHPYPHLVNGSSAFSPDITVITVLNDS